MQAVEIVLGGLLLLGPPVASSIAIRKNCDFWPLMFATFLGAGLTFINFFLAANFVEMANAKNPSSPLIWVRGLQICAWLSLILLGVGLVKIRRLKREEDLKKMLEED